MRDKEVLRSWFANNYPNEVVDIQLPYDARCVSLLFIILARSIILY